MGWRQPAIWVETTESPTVLAGPTDLDPFALTQSKSFLLGHAKCGPKASWDPVLPHRGIPEDASDTVRREWKMAQETEIDGETVSVDYDATHYTLAELKAIDLDEPLGRPDPAEIEAGEDTFEYGIDIVVEVDDGEYRPYYRYVDPYLVAEAIETGGVEVTLYEEGGRYYTPTAYGGYHTERDDVALDPSNRRECRGTLRAALRPRRFRAGDWTAFLNSLDDFGDREGVDDGLRVVLWSEK